MLDDLALKLSAVESLRTDAVLIANVSRAEELHMTASGEGLGRSVDGSLTAHLIGSDLCGELLLMLGSETGP